ncbi:hypothetical protein MTR_6g025740 [Medicago truncatula]|uniref:Transmembrane protein n=1 Tax=Medicago truncatula TaxID=3880 RepID=A0A072UI77_MEDTR|nr:hypothetical protein MTR_6g025740 [Medicago truncatula]
MMFLTVFLLVLSLLYAKPLNQMHHLHLFNMFMLFLAKVVSLDSPMKPLLID